jgi:hypothetical protein
MSAMQCSVAFQERCEHMWLPSCHCGRLASLNFWLKLREGKAGSRCFFIFFRGFLTKI